MVLYWPSVLVPSEPCLHIIWVLMSLHLLSSLLKMSFYKYYVIVIIYVWVYVLSSILSSILLMNNIFKCFLCCYFLHIFNLFTIIVIIITIIVIIVISLLTNYPVSSYLNSFVIQKKKRNKNIFKKMKEHVGISKL